MATLLVRNAHTLVTMDPARREIAGGGLFARDGFIEQVGPSADLPTAADQVVDAAGMLVLPGLINTHHHLYQTLTRAVPGAQDVGLFPWLKRLYPIWARMTPDDVGLATMVGLLELAHSGCTTVFDHQYLWPNGSGVGDQVAAAHEMGVRFHASRGAMSLGESRGGLPPDSVVEDEDAILDDCLRAIAAYHDPSPGSMTQIVVAPCSPFSVTPDLMRAAADLARDQKVRLHTHLAETLDEEHFCLETFGARPVEYAEDLGWSGPDVWFAHGVFVDRDEIGRMAAAGTGVAHCPTSNMRLASGIAPIAGYLAAGVPVGLGRGRFGLQRRLPHAGRGPPGHAAGPPGRGPVPGRRPPDGRPDRPGTGHPGRGPGAGAQRHRLSGAREVRRLLRPRPEPLGVCRGPARPGGGGGALRPRARLTTPSSRGGRSSGRGIAPASSASPS